MCYSKTYLKGTLFGRVFQSLSLLSSYISGSWGLWYIERREYGQTDKQLYGTTDILTNGQGNRQTYGQTYKGIDRLTEKSTNCQTDG